MEKPKVTERGKEPAASQDVASESASGSRQSSTPPDNKGESAPPLTFKFFVNDEDYPHLRAMADRTSKWAQFLADHGAEDVPDQKFAGLLCNDVAPLWERLMASNVTVSFLSARHRSDLASTTVTDSSNTVPTGWTSWGSSSQSSATREVVFEKQFQNPETWYTEQDGECSDPRKLAAETADAYFREANLGGFLKEVLAKDALYTKLDTALGVQKERTQEDTEETDLTQPEGLLDPFFKWWARRQAIKELSAHASEHRLALQLVSTVLNKIDSGAEEISTASLTGTKDTSIGHQLYASGKGILTFILSCSCQRDEWKAYLVEVRWWTRGEDGTWTAPPVPRYELAPDISSKGWDLPEKIPIRRGDNIVAYDTGSIFNRRNIQHLANGGEPLPENFTPNFEDKSDCEVRTPAMPSLVAVYCLPLKRPRESDPPSGSKSSDHDDTDSAAKPRWVKKLISSTEKDLKGDYKLREFLYQWEVVGRGTAVEDTDTGKRSDFWPEGATPYADNVYMCHPHKNFYILATRYPWYMLNDFCSELHEAMQRLGAASYTLTYKDFSTTVKKQEGEASVGAAGHGAGAQVKFAAEEELAKTLKESIHSSATFEPIAPDDEPIYDKPGRKKLYHFGKEAKDRRRRLGLGQDGYKLIFDEFESRMEYRSGPTRKLIVELTFSDSVTRGFAFEAALKALDYLKVGAGVQAKWSSFMSGTLSVELDVTWQDVGKNSSAGARLITRSAAAARSIAKLYVAAAVGVAGVAAAPRLAKAATTIHKHLY